MEPWATAEDFARHGPGEDPPRCGGTLGEAGEELAGDELTAALARACDTVEALQGELVSAQVMPFDQGTMQNTLTSVQPVREAGTTAEGSAATWLRSRAARSAALESGTTDAAQLAAIDQMARQKGLEV